MKPLLIGLLIGSYSRERCAAPAHVLDVAQRAPLAALLAARRSDRVPSVAQSSRSWQLWLVQNKWGCRFAWQHHRALLSWAELAQTRVKQRRGHVRGSLPWVLSSFVRMPAAAPSPAFQQVFSASASERMFSSRVHMRCCFFTADDPKSNCCGAVVPMRNVQCLWKHLETAHGVDEAAYMQRALTLGGWSAYNMDDVD